jgi:dephospho-CoA kinase
MKANVKKIIGLTGGIATGKTTVANYLANNHKLPIFDADIYARDAVAIGSPILQEITQRYGAGILLDDGSLNRPKLGEIIFHKQSDRLFVESLIHPYVRQRFKEAIATSVESIIVLVIPLLFESNLTHLVTETWVVYCNSEQQILRLMQRNNLTEEQAKARINSQMPLAEKVAQADIVLDNSSSLKELLKQVDEILNSYKNVYR